MASCFRYPSLSATCSSTTLIWVSLFLLLLFSGITEAVIKLPNNETVSAVIVFGDSIVDTGNNNNFQTLAKSNFPPYGRDFMGGVPTGRFSNGKVPSDLLAEELGVKDLLPAYRDPNLRPEDLLTGVCFATGGSGYDPLTSEITLVTSLDGQLQEFKEYIQKVRGLIGDEQTRLLLEKAVVVVVQSSNDIATTYYSSRIRAAHYDISSYTDMLVVSATNFVKELYGLGTFRIGVFGAPPLGCLPSTRTLAGGITRECNETYNQGSQLFNSKLSKALDSLRSSLPSSKVVYIDVYTPLLDLIKNYRSYGFEVGDKGCCGTGLLEAAVFCNKFSPHTCPDASKYVFWDGFHPTEKAYKLLVNKLLKKYVNSFV
ncbi:hypothetical protein K2173_007555 [Erythroxylum novogranatense]|uniref:GDSL esterase/lipase EXL3 n=1 Tax=Erythroxylum novogranatense TaxID=1862640 RepID=A0AAV8T802_9ROSI|nr:hypothetical protein K2173_007555 [Erythroxylum novogranatense]